MEIAQSVKTIPAKYVGCILTIMVLSRMLIRIVLFQKRVMIFKACYILIMSIRKHSNLCGSVVALQVDVSKVFVDNAR